MTTTNNAAVDVSKNLRMVQKHILLCAPDAAVQRAIEETDDAIRELVEADQECDAADEAWDNAPGNVQAIGDTDGRDYEGPEYQRLIRAIERRAAALRRFATGGE